MCVSASSTLLFFPSLPFSLLLLYLFLPLIKKKKKKRDITVLAGASSLPVPPSWQLANPARDEDAQPGHGVNPMQQKWGSGWRWLPWTPPEDGGGLPSTAPATAWECPWNGYSSYLAASAGRGGGHGRGSR